MVSPVRGEPDLEPIRVVFACSALGASRSETAAVLEQFRAQLESWGAELGLTFEVNDTSFPGTAPAARQAHLEDHRDPPAAEREALARWLANPAVYFVAVVLPGSSAIDKELAQSLEDARGGRAYPRYWILVDTESLLPDISSRPTHHDVSALVVPDLGSQSPQTLVEIAFHAITEMVRLDLPLGHDLGAESDAIFEDDPAPFPETVRAAWRDLPPSISAPGQRLDPALAGSGTERPREKPPRVVDENVQFTVYRPRAVRSGSWYPLLAFAHLAERRPGSPPEDPDPIEQVKALADQALGSQASAYSSPTSDARGAIPHESELTFVPSMDGVEFNPPRRTFRWLEDVHKEEFRLRADANPSGLVMRGQLTVFLGAFILADVDLVIRLDDTAAPPPRPGHSVAAAREAAPTVAAALEPARAHPYRKIFPSYSHRDSQIVEQAERLGAAMGDVYLRDRTTLRSGEDWSDRLLELIDEADVFQLFWSSNSMRSPYVRDEWEHAVTLGRRHFIRPTYWEDPLPRSDDPLLPPETLSPLHFYSLALPQPPTPRAAIDAGRGTPDSFPSPPSSADPGMSWTGTPGSEPEMCRSCGRRNEREALFCVSCGSYLAWTLPSPTLPRPRLTGGVQAIPVAYTESPGRRAAVPAWVLVIASVVLLIVVLILLLGTR